MTSTTRFSLAARLQTSQSKYVCLQCRLRASTAVRMNNPSITLHYAARRHASWLDTEKLRKKIWGSENPPGQEDPYGSESSFDRKRREREEERIREREQESGEGREPEPGPEGNAKNREDQIGYVEATTAEGLEIVGGPGWAKREWKAENEFTGFMQSEVTGTRNETVLAVHRALVETYALKEAGLPLAMNWYAADPTDDYAKSIAEGAQFEQDANGQMALVLESEELRHSILQQVTPRAPSSDGSGSTDGEIEDEEFAQEGVDSREAEEWLSETVKEVDDSNLILDGSKLAVPDERPFDPARSEDLAPLMPASDTWRNVSLEDAEIKFAILKRVMQLTGRRIADPDISTITTPTSLLVHLVKKPKPKRIAEVLLNSNQVAEIPNVQVFDKRYLPKDREVEVGRWKVIQEELKERGLYMPGRPHSRKVPRGLKQ